MFTLICVWINDWVNSCEAGDLRRYRIHYDVTVMGIWACEINDGSVAKQNTHQVPCAIWIIRNASLKSRVTLFVHKIRFNCPTVLKFCTEHGRITIETIERLLRLFWENEASSELSFGRISYIAQPTNIVAGVIKYHMTIQILFDRRPVISSMFPDSKVHWANMGLTWVLSAPDGSHVGPMNFAIRVAE